MRGAWIEIFQSRVDVKVLSSRSSCGERGLKSVNGGNSTFGASSLLMRGAWIEILLVYATFFSRIVAPHAGSVD